MTAAPPAEAKAIGPIAARLATPPGAGAIAIVAIEGETCRLEALLEDLTGVSPPGPGRIAVRRLVEVDEGVVARIDRHRAWLMPHGGRRIVDRIREALLAAGATWMRSESAESLDRHPEAADRHEAGALAALSTAASPAAIPLLLDQPRRWRQRDALGSAAAPFTALDRARWRRLDRLLDPPRVCVVGPPNAGKSTLANALAGREVAIASPIAGTTRDFVSTRIDLAGLVVEWIDLPGVPVGGRPIPDGIERAALELAAPIAATADVAIALAGPDQDWATMPSGTTADVIRVMSKSDRSDAANSPRATAADLATSAATGAGVSNLVRLVRDRLLPPEDLRHPGPWRWQADESAPDLAW